MSWFWNRGRKKYAPREIAEGLFREFVDKDPSADAPHDPGRLGLPQHIWTRFYEKYRLYREAFALMALLSSERDHPRYGEARKIFELLILPASSAQRSEGVLKQDMLREIMRSFAEVLDADRDEFDRRLLSWTRQRFFEQDVGCCPPNAADVMLFALHFARTYAGIREALNKMVPK